MIVCVCNAVSDRQIRRAIAEGHDTLDALEFELGIGSCCGKCVATACAVIDEETTCAPARVAHPLRFHPARPTSVPLPALA